MKRFIFLVSPFLLLGAAHAEPGTIKRNTPACAKVDYTGHSDWCRHSLHGGDLVEVVASLTGGRLYCVQKAATDETCHWVPRDAIDTKFDERYEAAFQPA